MTESISGPVTSDSRLPCALEDENIVFNCQIEETGRQAMTFGMMVLSMVFFASSLAAQPAPPPTGGGLSIMTEANVAYEARDWSNAARLYERVVATTPEPRAWYRLGVSRRNGGQPLIAISAFESGIKAGMVSYQGEFGIATALAMMNETEKAFDYLQRSVDHGLNMPDQLLAEESLAPLRSDPRFAKVVEHATRNQKPCAHVPENRQFDFWIGEWDVVTAGGTPAGQSKIELILGDCVVQESWQSMGSTYAGKSYNIYDIRQKRWEQFWVDNIGGRIFFYGELKDGVMDYWTDDLPQPDGPKLRRHLQFFSLGPDRVRQFSQGSTDGGKTWRVEYDFTYNRRK
jgi:hypothetical protein